MPSTYKNFTIPAMTDAPNIVTAFRGLVDTMQTLIVDKMNFVGDTGWRNFPFAANGWIQNQTGGAYLQYRVKNGVCYISGTTNKTSGAGTLLGTLPSEARPSRHFAIYGSAYNGPTAIFSVNPNGDVKHEAPYTSSGQLPDTAYIVAGSWPVA